MTQARSNTIAIILMLGAIFCFSSMDAVAKLAMEVMSPAQTIWARYVSQTLFVTVLILPRLRVLAYTKYPKLQIMRSVVLMGTTTLFFLGISQISLAEATAIMDVNPVLITLGAFLFLGERIGVRRVIGVCVSLVGALIVIRPGAGVFSIYALMPFGAALCYSAYSLATRFIGQDESPWTSLFYSAMFGAVCFSIYIAFHWQPMSIKAIGLMCLMGILGTMAQFLLIRALTLGEASLIAPFAYTGLIWAALYGLIIFNDIPDFWTLIGTTIIVAGGLYVWIRERLSV
jgi:drug/metabolite transporter (DMT)-like permease